MCTLHSMIFECPDSLQPAMLQMNPLELWRLSRLSSVSIAILQVLGLINLNDEPEAPKGEHIQNVAAMF